MRSAISRCTSTSQGKRVMSAMAGRRAPTESRDVTIIAFCAGASFIVSCGANLTSATLGLVDELGTLDSSGAAIASTLLEDILMRACTSSRYLCLSADRSSSDGANYIQH